MFPQGRFLAFLLALSAVPALSAESAPAAPTALDLFVREPQFRDLALSPSGEYFAATVPQGDKTVLAVFRRADMKVTSGFQMDGKTHVNAFWWVSPTRLLLEVGEKMGSLEQPRLTGEIYAIDAEGGNAEILAGPRKGLSEATGQATLIKPRDDGQTFAFMVDDLAQDDEHVIISTQSVYASSEVFTQAERMDVSNGSRRVLARAPVARAQFVADHKGDIRFAMGANSRNSDITYYRKDDDSDWEKLNDEAQTGLIVTPLGFSADNAIAYLQVSAESGPDVIESMSVATGERKVLLNDAVADPHHILVDPVSRAPIGVRYMDGASRTAFFEPEGPAARSWRSLEAAFPGHTVDLRSSTSDGRLQLVVASNDRNPGHYFLFDRDAKSAAILVSAAEWIDPAVMAMKKPIAFKARDGLQLRGYLTLPNGKEAAKNLPLILLPHGGPFFVRDDWSFEEEVQLLASQGYAVLQVNFRGSAGFGSEFEQLGAKQWGRTMQDDLTDATKWAISEGVANPERICIYGSSYGAYAALMGVAKEPDLYRCAAGNVGVYQLSLMFAEGDVQRMTWGENYLKDWLGEEGLDQISPTNLADRIKVPVFLAAGGEDERAPPSHTRAMERALKAAGVPVQTTIYPTEGHGYFDIDNRRDYYRRLLAFFSEHLGAATPH